MPPVITLLTDFGLDDWYVAAMQAVLLQAAPAARLLDVTHLIPPGDLTAATISLERALAMGLPPTTVHLAVVDPGVGSNRRVLIARINDQSIICPDNGLITWAVRRTVKPAKFYELTWRPPQSSTTFHGRDILAPAAAMLATGVAISQIAQEISDPVLLPLHLAANLTEAQVIYIDRFGNAITNVPASMISTDRILLNGANIGPLRKTYSDVAVNGNVALIGSSGLLEISIRDGSAGDQLHIAVGDPVLFVP